MLSGEKLVFGGMKIVVLTYELLTLQGLCFVQLLSLTQKNAIDLGQNLSTLATAITGYSIDSGTFFPSLSCPCGISLPLLRFVSLNFLEN